MCESHRTHTHACVSQRVETRTNEGLNATTSLTLSSTLPYPQARPNLHGVSARFVCKPLHTWLARFGYVRPIAKRVGIHPDLIRADDFPIQIDVNRIRHGRLEAPAPRRRFFRFPSPASVRSRASARICGRWESLRLSRPCAKQVVCSDRQRTAGAASVPLH